MYAIRSYYDIQVLGKILQLALDTRQIQIVQRLRVLQFDRVLGGLEIIHIAQIEGAAVGLL